ncbi:stage III sporulation protein AG [Bacillus aerolatus]|uniref:Stage III sporulation protein AG n=2 Tax=Bacillus aerolatus TaxID=2653354 RepID=A0A6I1FKR3_9BACI|nr:stage III sporulation protein AG [Bacillus aerolatus]
MAIAAILGIGFMLLSELKDKGEIDAVLPHDSSETANEQKETSPEDFETAYEKELTAALEQIAGVSNVTVVVTIEASERKVLEKNTAEKSQQTKEQDKKGGQRTITDQTRNVDLVMIKKDSGEEPVILEVKKPDIRGVLIVAEGVENIQVKKWVIESVTRALNVPSHRVAVMPKKPKEDA